MTEDIRTYFKDRVIPLVEREHPEAVPHVSIQLQGSAATGLNDEYSDMEAMLFLPKDVWKRCGGQLQLAMIHSLEPFAPCSQPYSESPGDPFSWALLGHPEINVHPRNELLSGQAEEIVAGEKDVPWDDVTMEELHQMQHCPILQDAGGFLAQLQAAAAPQRYPEQLWVKRLIKLLVSLKGGGDFEKCARRGRALEAQMGLGEILPGLLRAPFLLNKQYYPWPKWLFEELKALPIGPAELVGEFETIRTSDDWCEKSKAVSRIVRVLTELILASGMLTADMLECLFDANTDKAWENPDWREPSELRRKKAKEAGYDPRDEWIWGWWGWK